MSVPVIEPESHGLYRNVMGRAGASDLMSPNVGKGGRYVITTGEASTQNGGTAALTSGWRRLLDPQGPSFAIFVLGLALLLIHAHASASVSVSK
jgi:hypothetical protein